MGRVISKTATNVMCREADQGCGAVFNDVISESGGWLCTCPKCGRRFAQTAPPKVRVFSIGNKPWGDEGRSLRFEFDPAGIKDIGKTCPTLARAINPDTGRVEFENDSNQKEIYREMSHEAARIKSKQADKVAANEDRFLGDGRAPASDTAAPEMAAQAE